MLRWGGGSGDCCRVWEGMEMVYKEESASEMVGRDIGTAHCFRQEKPSGRQRERESLHRLVLRELQQAFFDTYSRVEDD